MPQRVHARIFRGHHGFPVLADLALAIGIQHGNGDTSLDKDWDEGALDDVGVKLNPTVAIGEDQVKFTLRTFHFPFAQRFDDDRGGVGRSARRLRS